MSSLTFATGRHRAIHPRCRLLSSCSVKKDTLSCVLPYPHNVAVSYPTHTSPAEDFAKVISDAQYFIAVPYKIGRTWPLLEIFEDKTKMPMKVVNSFL